MQKAKTRNQKEKHKKYKAKNKKQMSTSSGAKIKKQMITSIDKQKTKPKKNITIMKQITTKITLKKP